jgi:hypothetical protein
VAAARARVDAAGEAGDAARSTRLPGASIEATLTRFQEPMIVAPFHSLEFSNPPSFDRTLVQGRLAVAYTLFDGGERSSRIRGADAIQEASRYGLSATEMTVIEETASAYVGVLAAEAVRDASLLWDDTVVVVTADHGEEFYEHGKIGHKNTVYAESVHVPLIVKFPRGGPQGVDERLVSLVDLYPTLLEMAGAAPPAAHHGRSLLAAPVPERPIFHELLALRYLVDPDQDIETSGAQWRSIRQGPWKLVWEQDLRDESRHAVQLFDVRDDPGEARSLSERETARLQALAEAMVAGLEGFERDAEAYAPAGVVTLDDAEIERLKALGYLVEEAK